MWENSCLQPRLLVPEKLHSCSAYLCPNDQGFRYFPIMVFVHEHWEMTSVCARIAAAMKASNRETSRL